MRIISGTAKGRKLAAVPGDTTRPITDRVKSALFSILGGDAEGSTWLDLFAGTGSVGMEALSRGAESVVFVDRARRAIETIRHNLEHIELLDRAELVHDDAFRFLKRAEPGLAFDYIYVAPPQYQDLWAKVLLILHERPMLNEDGLIIVQIHPKERHELPIPRLELVDERRYGSTVLLFYALKSEKVGEGSLSPGRDSPGSASFQLADLESGPDEDDEPTQEPDEDAS